MNSEGDIKTAETLGGIRSQTGRREEMMYREMNIQETAQKEPHCLGRNLEDEFVAPVKVEILCL